MRYLASLGTQLRYLIVVVVKLWHVLDGLYMCACCITPSALRDSVIYYQLGILNYPRLRVERHQRESPLPADDMGLHKKSFLTFVAAD